MHFGNGATTSCRDVAPDGGGARCSDLNTTRFLRRVIEAERPDLITFTGAAPLFSSSTLELPRHLHWCGSPFSSSTLELPAAVAWLCSKVQRLQPC
jgi:hypothetical protein